MLSIIVAYDRKRTIGKQNKLPWHIPNDLAYFKRITTGNTVVMGRKTFESIGKPLPNRENVVLTRDKDFLCEGVKIVHSIEEITELNNMEHKEVFIIGGDSLYRQALRYTDKLYVTLIDAEFEGDTYFPEIDPIEWSLVLDIPGEKNEKNPYDYSFLLYERNKERV